MDVAFERVFISTVGHRGSRGERGVVAGAGPRGRRARLRQKAISPCLHASGLHASGQRIALISILTSLYARGMARRQSAVPGLLQADVRQRPDHGAQRCTRALRRANGHLRLTPRQRPGRPGALCPWWLDPSVARGPVCVIADPQVPSRSVPYERLRKAPLELGPGWVTRRVKYEGCQEIFTEGEWAGGFGAIA